MSKAMTETKNATPDSVKVVGGKLILSLPHAQSPVVWQMNIETAQSAGFIVKENKKDKVFALILKQESAEGEEIAVFEEKADAVSVLMEASEALQNFEQAHSAPAASVVQMPAAAAPQTGAGQDKKGAIIAVCLVVTLIIVWSIIAMGSPESPRSYDANGSVASSASGGAAASQSGVPVSADDFLSNR